MSLKEEGQVERETVIAERGSCVETTQDFWLEAVELL